MTTPRDQATNTPSLGAWGTAARSRAGARVSDNRFKLKKPAVG